MYLLFNFSTIHHIDDKKMAIARDSFSTPRIQLPGQTAANGPVLLNLAFPASLMAQVQDIVVQCATSTGPTVQLKLTVPTKLLEQIQQLVVEGLADQQEPHVEEE